MGKYEKGQQVSYKGSSNYVGKGATGANSRGTSRGSDSGKGTITSVQNNTVRVSNEDGSSTTVHKNRVN